MYYGFIGEKDFYIVKISLLLFRFFQLDPDVLRRFASWCRTFLALKACLPISLIHQFNVRQYLDFGRLDENWAIIF